MRIRVGERRLRRSLFFVPGGDSRKLEKALGVGADTLLLDLEDSVAPDQKARARELVVGVLREAGFGASEPAVRVNPPGTPFFEADLEAVIGAGAQAILLPKCEDAEALARVAERMGNLAGGQDVRLLALVETAAGITRVASLAEADERIDALCFGHADFSRDMGLAAADPGSGVLLHARCALAVAAKAGGVAPVDTVCLDVRDEEAFRRDAALGRSLGFEGKLCIHPRQVPLANQAYTPTPVEIEYAQRVVEASRKAEAEGRGVFTVDGKMVDAPLVDAQRQALARARRAGALGADAAPGKDTDA